MNKIIYQYGLAIFILIISIGVFVSCNDDDDNKPDRLFRPQITETFVSYTYFEAKWERYAGADKFELQLSVDSFRTIYKQIVTDSTTCRFDGLWYDTQYQLRIRSIGENLMSAYYVAKDFKTQDLPTKLNSLKTSDVIDTQAKITWTDVSYDYLKIYKAKGDTLLQTITVTDRQNENKEVIVKNLQPQKSYRVEAYKTENDKEAYQGKKTFKTIASQQLEGEIVDLRDLSQEESLDKITPSYLDGLASAYPNGVTVILNGGTTYNISTDIPISADITFVTGLSFAGYAAMALDGSFTVSESATINRIKFDKIEFTEGPNNPKTSENFGKAYLLNLNKPGITLRNLNIENCVIKYKRGVIRLQDQITIDNLKIDNCIIDSIGGYGVVNNANDKAYIGDIKVTNTTISHADALFVGGKQQGINSLTLENITTCFAPKDGGYIFNYDKNTVPGGIAVRNSVFGIGGKLLEPETLPNVNALRSAGASVLVTNNFRTSDLSLVPKYALDFSDVGQTTSKLFADPAKNNYTVTNTMLKNKAGDPRWW